MSGPLPPHTRTRLEKAAADNGFDQALPESALEPGWIGFASTQCRLWLWLSLDATNRPIVAFSQLKVCEALATSCSPTGEPVPLGARGVLAVEHMSALHAVLRRAFQLSRTLPDEPLRVFEMETKSLRRETEIERLVVQRIGQNIFRERLLEYWEGRCAVTGLAVPELLRASHVKPWADCETDAERLDVFNGLLLAPHIDASFDCGFITVSIDASVLISSRLTGADRRLLGLEAPLRVHGLSASHEVFLPWHRARVFKR